MSLWMRLSSRVMGARYGKGGFAQRGRQGPDSGVSVPTAALWGLQDTWPPRPRRVEHLVCHRTHASWMFQVLSEPQERRRTCWARPAHQPCGRLQCFKFPHSGLWSTPSLGGPCVHPSVAAARSSRLQPAAPAPGPTCPACIGAGHPVGRTQGV